MLIRERLLLDFQLDDFALKLIQSFWFGVNLHPDA
ncbi:Uncharacterised protein [Vibrio cholerae]|nr:Uncharacterised protein [Vibrio cholerae]